MTSLTAIARQRRLNGKEQEALARFDRLAFVYRAWRRRGVDVRTAYCRAKAVA